MLSGFSSWALTSIQSSGYTVQSVMKACTGFATGGQNLFLDLSVLIEGQSEAESY